MLSNVFWPEVWQATWETVYMVGISMFFSILLGLPLGVLLVTTDRRQITENIVVNRVIGTLINIDRSIPFIILLVAIIPFTRMVVGTSIGTTAAIVPLTVGAIPLVARIVEQSLREVSGGVVEAALAMGSNPWQIILKVLLPEALPSIVLGLTLTIISLIGYSAIAGAIGGGGLGDLGYRYGYQRWNGDVLLVTVVVLVLMVQLIQMAGDYLARTIYVRRGGK